MSITSEITRIKTNIANAYTEVENKDGIIIGERNSDNLSTVIKSIPTKDAEMEASYLSSIDDTLGANVTKLPSGITTIGDYAFFRKSGLKLTKLEQELTSIGSGAFNGCSNVAITEISSSVLELINANAFTGTAITELDIKSPVLDIIGNNAFSSTSLNKIIIRRTDGLVTARTTIFNGTPIAKGTGYIYVDDSLKEQYKSASNWSVYASQIKGISEIGG